MDHISRTAWFLKVPITHIFCLKFSAKLTSETPCLFIKKDIWVQYLIFKDKMFHSELYLQPKPE